MPSVEKTDVGTYTGFALGASWEDGPSLSGFKWQVCSRDLKLRRGRRYPE